MPVLSMCLFGRLSVCIDGAEPVVFPGRRIADLLGYLVLHREARHSRDTLAGLLWGELEEAKARHCLNTSLWRLHGLLGRATNGDHPYLLVDAQSVGFNPKCDYRLDIAEFEHLCAVAERDTAVPERQAARLHQAVKLYHADLLTDCYGDWCLFDRERLLRLYLRALGTLLAYHAARGEDDAAIECGNQILARDPLREEVHRHLIGIYLASGRPALAMRQYRECEAVLRRELGIAPMPETQLRLKEILFRVSDRPSRLIKDSQQTPAAQSQFVGLDALVETLREVAVYVEAMQGQLRTAIQTIEQFGSRDGALDDRPAIWSRPDTTIP